MPQTTHAAAFEERFADRSSLVDGMPSFISFQLLRPKNDDDPYVDVLVEVDLVSMTVQRKVALSGKPSMVVGLTGGTE